MKTALSRNLQVWRAIRTLTQDELAAQADISRSQYIKLESGSISDPRSSTVINLARALGVDVHTLYEPIPHFSSTRFRANSKLTAKELLIRDILFVQLKSRLEYTNWLESKLCDSKSEQFKKLSAAANAVKHNGAEGVASTIRTFCASTHQNPADDICGFLADHGVKVFLKSVEIPKFFGCSIGPQDGGPVIVINIRNDISVERRIFTAVHELAHLLLHEDIAFSDDKVAEKAIEKEADVLTGYFLMPTARFAEAMRQCLGLGLYDTVLKVKRMFKVSYLTVIHRLSERSGKIDSALYGKLVMRFRGEHRARTGVSLGAKVEPSPISHDDDLGDYFIEDVMNDEPEHLAPTDVLDTRFYNLVMQGIHRRLVSIEDGARIIGRDKQFIEEELQEKSYFESI